MGVRLSKQLAYVLRHDPSSVNLRLDNAGWVALEELAAALNVDVTKIEDIIASDDKSRFALVDGLIRANQGHSINVDLKLANAAPPEFLFHGTVERFLDSILGSGLTPQRRHAVHLSKDKETAVNVASRRGEPVILTVASGEMSRAGHAFQVSENGVWLTNTVPSEFITV